MTVKSIWQCSATRDCRDYYETDMYKVGDRDWHYTSHVVFAAMFVAEVRLYSSNVPWSFTVWNASKQEFTAYNPDMFPITPFYGKDLRLL